jgi:hypothetical protein
MLWACNEVAVCRFSRKMRRQQAHLKQQGQSKAGVVKLIKPGIAGKAWKQVQQVYQRSHAEKLLLYRQLPPHCHKTGRKAVQALAWARSITGISSASDIS